MKFFISTICSSKKEFPEILNDLYELEFRNIEITGNISYCDHYQFILKEYMTEKNCDFLIHNYIPFETKPYVLNLASKNRRTIDKTIFHIKKAIEILKSMDKYYYSLHPGFHYDLLPIISTDNYFVRANNSPNDTQTFYDMLLFIKDTILDENNFSIAIENLHPRTSQDTFSFVCTPDDIMNYLSFIKNIDNYGFLLDLGHLNIASNKLNFDKFNFLDELFSKFNNKIFQIHLSDNNGLEDSHHMCTTNSWQITYLYNNKKYLSDIPVTMEWSSMWRESALENFLKITHILS